MVARDGGSCGLSRPEEPPEGGTLTSRILRLFSRTTSGAALIREIDGLRFVALLGVMLSHATDYLWKYRPESPVEGLIFETLMQAFVSGFLGVQLFFMVSGFILAVPFARTHLARETTPELKSYYIRRLTRIEPPYLINLTVLFAYLVFLRGNSADALWPHWLASCCYCHNFWYGTGSSINGVAWSLEVEVQFYIVAPLLALIFRVPSKVLRRAILVGGMVLASQLFVKDAGNNHGYHLLTEINFFLTGFLLADCYLTDWQSWKPPRDLLWDGCGLIAVGALTVIAHLRGADSVLVPPLLFVIARAAFHGRLCHHLLTHPAIFTIGGMCYTVYLYHYRLFAFVDAAVTRFLPLPQTGLAPFFIALITLLTMAITVSAGLFVVIEKPFMQRHWLSRSWAAIRFVRSPVDRPVRSVETKSSKVIEQTAKAA